MKNQNLKNVTVNTDSTMNQTALSYPPIGYHTLKLLDGLRQSYNDASKRINKVRKNQRISNTTKDQLLLPRKRYPCSPDFKNSLNLNLSSGLEL